MGLPTAHGSLFEISGLKYIIGFRILILKYLSQDLYLIQAQNAIKVNKTPNHIVKYKIRVFKLQFRAVVKPMCYLGATYTSFFFEIFQYICPIALTPSV